MSTNNSQGNTLVIRDVVGASVAGSGGAVVREAAAALYEAAGKEILAEGAQKMLRAAVVKGSGKLVENAFVTLLPEAARELASAGRLGTQLLGSSARASTNLLASGAKSVAQSATTEVAKSAATEAAKVAGKELLKGVGKTVGVGFAVDAVFGTIEAVQGVRAGEMSRKDALVHVGKEAATGAVATAVGAAACAGLVALTGPLGIAALLVVGGGSSFGAKRALRWLLL